jgi:integrase
MAVLKRSGTKNWFIEFTHLGATVRRSSGTTVKSKAKELEAEWRRQIYERQRLGKAPTIKLGEAIDRYYATILEPTGKPKTLKKDLYCLNAIRSHFGPDTSLDDLKQAEVAEWRDAMVEDHGLAASSANRMWAYLRAILTAGRDEWGISAPAIRLKALRENPGRVRFLSAEEEHRLLEACSPHVRSIVLVIMDSGMRKSDATSLLWSDVQWTNERAVLRLRASETKNAKSRRVPLTKRATEVLVGLRDTRPKDLNNDNVFLYQPHGRDVWIPFENFRTGFKRACERAGIDDFHIHDLRHHYASRLAQRGAPLQMLMELMGHSSIKMVLRYAHLIPSNLDQAVTLLDVA